MIFTINCISINYMLYGILCYSDYYQDYNGKTSWHLVFYTKNGPILLIIKGIFLNTLKIHSKVYKQYLE